MNVGNHHSHRGDSDHHPPLANSPWPSGQVARWPGGHSHISSRKIYYLVGKSTSQKTAFGESAVARWPGGQSLLSSRKSTSRRRACTLCSSISFAFHFAILCSGHRGHPGHRVFFGAVSHSAVPLRRDVRAPHKPRMSCKRSGLYTMKL